MIEDGWTLTSGRRRFLRYWALNMTLARQQGSGGMPGFTYGPDEWTRMDALAAAIPAAAAFVWLASAVVIFLAMAGALMGAAMGLVLPMLWPKAADTPAAGFFGLLILCLMVAIGFGLPLAVVLGGVLADGFAKGAPTAEAPEDAALFAKVVRQFLRMSLVIGVLVALAVVGWTLVGKWV